MCHGLPTPTAAALSAALKAIVSAGLRMGTAAGLQSHNTSPAEEDANNLERMARSRGPVMRSSCPLST